MRTRSVELTTWFLEQRSPADLKPAAQSAAQIVRAEVPSPELSRYLYTAVGGDHLWTDRLVWSYEHWSEWLERPGVETWLAWERGTPAGYAELAGGEDGEVEITCFGLVPSFIGRGIGGHLLSEGTARAWDLGSRRPDGVATTRVWLHTCSLDGPAALPNYERRGFGVYETRVAVQDVWERPLGPWPGARPA